jgi:hypothetical protein
MDRQPEKPIGYRLADPFRYVPQSIGHCSLIANAKFKSLQSKHLYHLPALFCLGRHSDAIVCQWETKRSNYGLALFDRQSEFRKYFCCCL